MTKDHVDQSIARALKGESNLDPEVLKIRGFSTPIMRHLFNNLCNIEGGSYLEIGVFKGASFIAAFNNNSIHAVGIDDFSQDFSQANVREELEANLEQWRHTAAKVEFIEGDCFELAAHSRPDRSKFDIYVYDGHHDFAPTANALPAFFNLLSDRFIYIVDDFHWATVNLGVTEGFERLAGKVNIVQEWELSGAKRQDDPIFWNGLAIFLCEKIK